MFNDTSVDNRTYAYLANVEISKFNQLEMEVLNKLSYNSLINPEEYKAYEKELESFWKTQEEVLNWCYTDYKEDKLILKEIKNKILNKEINSKINMRDVEIDSNFEDQELSNIIKKSHTQDPNTKIIEWNSKFRFESYNSNAFKEKCISKNAKRSKSV